METYCAVFVSDVGLFFCFLVYVEDNNRNKIEQLN